MDQHGIGLGWLADEGPARDGTQVIRDSKEECRAAVRAGRRGSQQDDMSDQTDSRTAIRIADVLALFTTTSRPPAST